MDLNDIRGVVIERLTKRGWIKKSWVKETTANRTDMMVEWTDVGKQKMAALCALYDELGYSDTYISGELQILCQMSHMCRAGGGAAGGPPNPGNFQRG